jgi:hypothetical protein
MSIRRTIIIPAILALSTAGSIVAGSALTATVAQVPVAATSTVHPSIFYQS